MYVRVCTFVLYIITFIINYFNELYVSLSPHPPKKLNALPQNATIELRKVKKTEKTQKKEIEGIENKEKRKNKDIEIHMHSDTDSVDTTQEGNIIGGTAVGLRANMEFVFQSMPKFDRKTGTISEWLNKFECRCGIANINEDAKRIQLCKLFSGQTGEDILGGLPDATTWEQAKQALIDRIGEGSLQEEAWTALKNLTRNGRDLVDVGSEAEKWASRAYPGQAETARRHAVEAFIRTLDGPLALEVQKLGHTTLEDVISAARRIERLHRTYPAPGMDGLVTVMQEELKALRKELKENQTKNAAAAVFTGIPPAEGSSLIAAAIPRDHSMAPEAAPGFLQRMPSPTQYSRPPGRPRSQPTPRTRRCFFCDEEGHFIAQCPFKEELKQWRQMMRGRGPRAPLPLEPATPQEHQLNF